MKRLPGLKTIFMLVFLQSLIAMDVFAEATKPPIRIGVSLGLTGRYAELSRSKQLAFQLWEQHINQRGGILERPVQIIIQDDKSNPDTAVKIYKRFTEEEEFEFIFGPYSSQITEAVAPITEKNKYPMLAHGAADTNLWNKGYGYLFGIPTPANRFLIGFLALLAEQGIKRIGLVGVDDTYSLGIAEGAKRWADDYELDLVYQSTLSKKDPSLEAAAKAAREAGAQALIMAGHFEESVAMRLALKRIKWTPTAYYASSGPILQKYYESLGEDAQYTFSSSSWEPRDDMRLPGSVEFLNLYRSKYKETPSYHAAQAFAAGQILEQAILKTKSLNRVAIRDAIATLEAQTIIGRLTFDRTGAPAKGIPLIVQWQKGKREIVWPENLRTTRPIFAK